MSRILSRVTMSLLVAGMLCMTGCGGGGGSPTTPTNQTQSALKTDTFNGKSFTTSDGVITFNTNGTLSGTGANTYGIQAWSINSSGQLIVTNTGKGTATFTLASGDATNGWTGYMVYSNGTSSTGTLVPVSNVATTTMFSGKSFTTSDGVITFNANSTLSGTGANTYGIQAWSINSSGQLVVTNTGKGTATFTLVSGDATNGWTGNMVYSNGTS